MGVFDFLKRKTNKKAIFCGLDSSGKSTFISFLQTGTFVEHTPTMGKAKKEMEVEGTKISLFDMGGQKDFRDMWFGELKSAQCVVFIIDKANPERFSEAKTELEKLLPLIKKEGINLLILANKHDIPQSAKLGEIIKYFNLFELDNFEILDISAKTGYGIADAFTRFYSMLTGETLKKSVFATGISVYNNGGVPILTQVSEGQDEINQKALEGGFLAAITQFSNNKLDSTTNIIHFKSENNGTFIVARSKNFIGSLLWSNKLNVSIEQSEDALRELLSHLENSADPSNEEEVAFHVQHYMTNLM